MTSYLIVVAHPDDEVLGAGATIAKLAAEGHKVYACILSGLAEARSNRPTTDELTNDMNSAVKLLGVTDVITGVFPNIAFNTVPHIKLVQFVEQAIIETKAEVVFTHHPSDLNNDHYHTSIACQAAIRLFQRRTDLQPVKELLFMEVPSATDWSLNIANRQFTPNTFIEVGEANVDKKIKALSQYRNVMHQFPHPRSIEVLKGLAACRGGQAGMIYAEAFESVFRRIV